MSKQAKRRMTFKEFLAAIPKGGWDIFNNEIRRGYGATYQCPITSVCLKSEGRMFDINGYPAAASILGLDSNLAKNIASASDNRIKLFGVVSRYKQQIRRALLKATGLYKKK